MKPIKVKAIFLALVMIFSILPLSETGAALVMGTTITTIGFLGDNQVVSTQTLDRFTQYNNYYRHEFNYTNMIEYEEYLVTIRLESTARSGSTTKLNILGTNTSLFNSKPELFVPERFFLGKLLILGELLDYNYQYSNAFSIDFSSFNLSQSNVITRVTPGTSVSVLKQLLKLKVGTANFTITNSSGTSIDLEDKIGTGTTISVTQNSVPSNYKIVIYGDVTGDGLINIDDLAVMKSHLLKINPITKSSFLSAGDIFKKGNISISDLIAIKKNLLGLAVITQ